MFFDASGNATFQNDFFRFFEKIWLVQWNYLTTHNYYKKNIGLCKILGE